MRRTQLYLDEEMARTLSALSRQRGASISELVRESVRLKYMTERAVDRAEIARRLAGIWADRQDLRKIEDVVRALRRGQRLRRYGFA